MVLIAHSSLVGSALPAVNFAAGPSGLLCLTESDHQVFQGGKWDDVIVRPQLAVNGTELLPPSDAFVKSGIRCNQNAACPAERYGNHNARRIGDIDMKFVHEPTNTAARVLDGKGNGDVILDAGCGFLLYDIEFARRGWRVIAVDTKDYYSTVLEPMTAEKSYCKLFERYGKNLIKGDYIVSVGLLDVTRFQNLAEVFRISLPEYVVCADGEWQMSWEISTNQFVSDMRRVSQNILDAFYAEEKRLGIVRVLGLVEDVLDYIKDGSLTSVIDVCGSLMYSEDTVRKALYERYHRKLKPGVGVMITDYSGD